MVAEKGAGAVELACAQQSAGAPAFVAERAAAPLDTISGADAQIVLDAPFYYHWPSGDLVAHVSKHQTMCAGFLLLLLPMLV
jgi:hypothetical protein